MRALDDAAKSAGPSLRLARSAVIGAMIACAACYIALPMVLGWPRSPNSIALWRYNGAAIGLSYLDTGFARHELEGTLIRLFTADPIVGGAVFHLLACLAAATLALLVVLRTPMSDGRRLALGALFLAVLMRIGADVGRPDMAVMVCGFVAAWAARAARWIVAALAVCVALALHEIGFIVLAPLTLAIGWEHGAWRRGRRWAAAGLIGTALAAFALRLHPAVDPTRIGPLIHARFHGYAQADIGVYYLLSGARGIANILCQRQFDGAYLSHFAKGLGLVAACIAVLRARRWRLTALAVVPSYVFASTIACDYARWGELAVFSVALMAALEASPEPLSAWRAGASILLAGLMVLNVGVAPDFANPIVVLPDFLVGPPQRLDPVDAATACDPGWRAYIGL